MPGIILVSNFGGYHTRLLFCHSESHKQDVAEFSLSILQRIVGVFSRISRQMSELIGSIEMMIVHSP